MRRQAGGKIITDSEQKRYFIWKNEKISNGGDVLGNGAWGKIIISDEKIVAKIPVDRSTCKYFYKEHEIINDLHKILGEEDKHYYNIKNVTSELIVGQPQIKGEIALMEQKYDKDQFIEVFKDTKYTCIFFMDRIYKPKKNTLLNLINEKYIHHYKSGYSTIERPYYLFLGRISKGSIRGGISKLTDVDSLPLSMLREVYKMKLNKHFELLMQNIEDNYIGTEIVVSNYIVTNNSHAMKYGRGICLFLWRAFYEEKTYLVDTEFVLGDIISKKTQTVPNCFIIDFNKCYKLDELNNDKFIQSIAPGMELKLEGLDPEAWGGFLPNPLISPKYAFDCWKFVMEKYIQDDIEQFSIFIDFMNKLVLQINNLLYAYPKMIIGKEKHNTIMKYMKQCKDHHLFVEDNTFEVIPANIYTIMVDIEDKDYKKKVTKNVKNLENAIIDFNCYWKRCFILEIILAFINSYIEMHKEKIESNILILLAINKINSLLPIIVNDFLKNLNIISSYDMSIVPTEEEINEVKQMMKPTTYLVEEVANNVTYKNINLFGDDE